MFFFLFLKIIYGVFKTKYDFHNYFLQFWGNGIILGNNVSGQEQLITDKTIVSP